MSDAIQIIKEAKNKLIGLKQTLRAIQQDRVQTVYIANDIEDHIARQITAICHEKGVPLVPVDLTQKELGRLCQIDVGAAVVSLII